MSGTPYVYQGEEIGMTNPNFESIKDYRDVESINYFNILKEEGIDEKEIMEILKSKSRDNSRTSVQWNEEKNAGFTTGTPWINIANNYREINVERALENKDSVFYHYKKLIELRKNEDVIAYGDYIQFLEDHPKVYAYERNYNGEKLLVINNFYGEECLVDLSKEIEGLENYNKSILISNYKDSTLDLLSLKLRPYESIVYKLEK
ncbi:alpha-glucosidase C-terminal domain-containing protein, partial [Clostridium perfringens]|uniref:alpha-amylase family glycosyl hydrolase n=1 Tax=Clostridium perfringens TaxID=1502 RepID=UPI0002E2B77B